MINIPKRDIACPMIIKSIKEEREAVKSYRMLLDEITPITDKMEEELPGHGEEILKEIDSIIEDEMKHDKAMMTVYNGIGCKGKGLSSLMERK